MTDAHEAKPPAVPRPGAKHIAIYGMKQRGDTVKAITDPNNIFRNLYEKTCRASMGQA